CILLLAERFAEAGSWEMFRHHIISLLRRSSVPIRDGICLSAYFSQVRSTSQAVHWLCCPIWQSTPFEGALMISMAVIGICRRRNSSREPPEIFACLQLSKTVTCMV